MFTCAVMRTHFVDDVNYRLFKQSVVRYNILKILPVVFGDL